MLGPVADCLGCGQTAGKLPPLRSALLREHLLRRCDRCGLRQTTSAGDGRVLLDCNSCGLPFLAAPPETAGGARCADCEVAGGPQEIPGTPLAAATEHEVRLALESRWRFLTSRSATVYLDKILRQVAARIEDAPDDCRVALFDDKAPRTLALPSGLILVSQGTLDLLEDEAQLAFLLARELAHVASADGAALLVRMGFHAVAQEVEDAGEKAAWADAAEDLVRLGYGKERETEADRLALEAVLDLGYDPDSVARLLRRIGTLVERGEPRIAEMALAHPPSAHRIRRLEETLHGRVEPWGQRPVNREVFRRAVGRHSATMEWASLGDLSGAAKEGVGGTAQLTWKALIPWIGLVLALLASLIVLLNLTL
jgi:hypothetical protein